MFSDQFTIYSTYTISKFYCTVFVGDVMSPNYSEMRRVFFFFFLLHTEFKTVEERERGGRRREMSKKNRKWGFPFLPTHWSKRGKERRLFSSGPSGYFLIYAHLSSSSPPHSPPPQVSGDLNRPEFSLTWYHGTVGLGYSGCL